MTTVKTNDGSGVLLQGLGAGPARGVPMRSSVILTVALTVTIPVAAAGAETTSVVAGSQYARGGTHRMLFGSDYRELWTTAATLEVLDLQHEAGGLTPTLRVGGQQTKGLAFQGKDGRNYTFRGLDKDASEILDEDLVGTIVDDLLRDAGAAQHPASEVIARGLLEATGIPCPSWRLVVLPDDPALGAFRKEFAGAVGVLRRLPECRERVESGLPRDHRDHRPPRDVPATAGGRGRRADVQALLKARLMDIFMGDWDRHRKQWRWARFPDKPPLGAHPRGPRSGLLALRRTDPRPRPAATTRGSRSSARGTRASPASPPTAASRIASSSPVSPATSSRRRPPSCAPHSPTTRSTRRWRACRRSGERSTASGWPRT